MIKTGKKPVIAHRVTSKKIRMLKFRKLKSHSQNQFTVENSIYEIFPSYLGRLEEGGTDYQDISTRF